MTTEWLWYSNDTSLKHERLMVAFVCFRLAGRLLQELRAFQQCHLDLELEVEGVLGGGVATDLTELPH